VWTIPVGVIYATTNIHLGLNVFTEYIIGYMQPGRLVAMMLFKTYGYITMNQAHAFLNDLKLGHYLKIPQRVTFCGQVVTTLWSCLVQLAVMEWALSNITDNKFSKFKNIRWLRTLGTFEPQVSLCLLRANTNPGTVCKEGQANNFTCPNGRVFFNASVIFGLIGPKRIFSTGALYGGLQWFWFAGAITPFLISAGARLFPRSKIRFFSAPIFFGGMGG
jgi:OPT family oligopeptide transporter